MAFGMQRYWWALVLFVLAAVSDGVDGFLARVLNQRSRLGAMLDPLADKILIVTSYILLARAGWLPDWLAVLVVSRDFIILGGLVVLQFNNVDIRSRIRPLWPSKINTTCQLLLVFYVLMGRQFGFGQDLVQAMLVWIVAGLTVLTTLLYIRVGMRLLPNSEEPGIISRRDAKEG
jgi:cardiolipin synthase